MNVAKLKMMCWKAVWRILSLATLFSVLCNLIPTQQEYNIVEESRTMNNRVLEIEDQVRTVMNMTENVIPHIVHQTWDSVNIPKQVRNWSN